MVRISVLYFGGAREAAGTSEEHLELDGGVRTVADLAAHLERVHPALAGRLAGVRFALNETFVDLAAELGTGDVVAVIPPVSGG